LHGHPTRSAALNEALVFPALGLFVPYRSFRDTHLRHHNDANLTDPYDDPESWYLPLPEWNRAGSAQAPHPQPQQHAGRPACDRAGAGACRVLAQRMAAS
jgi:hypothetical protein